MLHLLNPSQPHFLAWSATSVPSSLRLLAQQSSKLKYLDPQHNANPSTEIPTTRNDIHGLWPVRDFHVNWTDLFMGLMYLPTTSHCNFLRFYLWIVKQPCFMCFILEHILIKVILSPSLNSYLVIGDLVSGTSPPQHPAASSIFKDWQLRVQWTKTPCWDLMCCKSLVSHLLISVDQPSCVEEKMWRQKLLDFRKSRKQI